MSLRGNPSLDQRRRYERPLQRCESYEFQLDLARRELFAAEGYLAHVKHEAAFGGI